MATIVKNFAEDYCNLQSNVILLPTTHVKPIHDMELSTLQYVLVVRLSNIDNFQLKKNLCS